MSFKHFLLHDFVHGVWHLDKGFPATLKKAFVNPGKEIRDYLAGKRVCWFSILTLILLLFAAINFVSSKIPDYGEPLTFENKEIESFVNHNAKWFLLTFCFVYSWASRLIFRRAGLNLSEHTVMNTFFFIGILVIFLTEALFNYWGIDIGFASPLAMLVYMAYAYYGAFGRLYTFPGWLWRIVDHISRLIDADLQHTAPCRLRQLLPVHSSVKGTKCHHLPPHDRQPQRIGYPCLFGQVCKTLLCR